MLVSAGSEKLAGCVPPIFQPNVCASVSVCECVVLVCMCTVFIVFSLLGVSA